MNPSFIATVAFALLIAAPRAEGQSGRTGSLPSPTRAPAATQVPMIVLSDGSVVADFGRGYERVIRSCAAYSGSAWPAGQPRGRSANPAPQGGSASRPPGANGLPPVPGMSPPPGAQRPASVGTSTTGGSQVGRSTVGRSTVGSSAVGSSTAGTSSVGRSSGSLTPTHSAWRTAGPVYYDGACYVQDAYGRLRLIRL